MMDVDTLNSAVDRMWLRIRHDESDQDSRGILAEVVVKVWEGGKLPKQENLTHQVRSRRQKISQMRFAYPCRSELRS